MSSSRRSNLSSDVCVRRIFPFQCRVLCLDFRSPKLFAYSRQKRPSQTRYANESPTKSLRRQVRRTSIHHSAHSLFVSSEKTIRRKRSRKSFLPDQRSSDSQIGSAAPVVYVSSMIDIQPTIVKSSPRSDVDQDNNPLLISDDDNEHTKKGGLIGGGEDQCAVEGTACLRPSGSSIKCK